MDKEKHARIKHLWYIRNKESHILSQKKRRSQKRDYVQQAKMANPACTDCGIEYPYYVLDYDHLPQFEKSFPLSSSGVKDRSIESIKAEIAKCELVCSNCHRHRTYVRTNNL
jgi:hypothetical protein